MKRLPLLLVGLTLLILLGGLTAWRVQEALTRRTDAGEATATAGATPVEVVEAGTRDLVEEARVAGSLRPRHEAGVSAEIPGRVVAVPVDVGTAVTRGQVLARLDDEDLALGVQQAEAAVAAARAGQTTAARDLAGAKALVEVGGVAEAQVLGLEARLAGADAQLAQATAGLALARSRLADATLRAPFDGVVVSRTVDLGAQLAPGMPAFTVADLSELELVLEVDARIAARVRPGDAVAIRSDLATDLPDGVVKTVSPALDATSRKAQVVVVVPAAPGLLGHGGATGTFQVGRADGVVAVPRGALLADKGEQVVYVVDGGTARRTVVVPGLQDGTWVAVAGLSAGARVVVTGNVYLSDGAAVVVRSGEPS